ncbi:MAG: hypothetical protein ACLFQK_04605 [Fibrobacterota bacterium]
MKFILSKFLSSRSFISENLGNGSAGVRCCSPAGFLREIETRFTIEKLESEISLLQRKIGEQIVLKSYFKYYNRKSARSSLDYMYPEQVYSGKKTVAKDV